MMNFLRRWVLHNFWLKILSLLLATGLWLAIAPDEEPAEVAVRVPIEFQHVPPHLEISSVTIPEAQIRVRGPEQLIRNLRSTDIHAELDLADAKPGDRTFDLTAQQIRHQRELHIVQVVPGQVHLSFDMRLTRDVEIRPRVTGTFLAGEQIAKVLVDPERSHHHRSKAPCGDDGRSHHRSHRRLRNSHPGHVCDQRLCCRSASADSSAYAGPSNGDHGEDRTLGGRPALKPTLRTDCVSSFMH